MISKITACGDNIVVTIVEEEDKTDSGIYIPDRAKAAFNFTRGIVLSIGKGDGAQGLGLKPGSLVLMAQLFETGRKMDGKKLAICHYENIAAEIEEK